MNTKKVFTVLFLTVALLGCDKQSTNSLSPSILEGTVKHLPGGGTVEDHFEMPGFVLTEYQWITPPPDSTHGLIYLIGKVDTSYINKDVRVAGKVISSTLYGTLVIDVDTLNVIN